MINKVLTAWGCCGKQTSSEMASGRQPLLGSLLAVRLGGDGWKCQCTKVCAHAVWLAWEEGQEKQAALAGCMEETLGEGGTWLDVGGCGAKVSFEGVFHEDMSDKPDWKGECLQPGTWEEAAAPGLQSRWEKARRAWAGPNWPFLP